jgi:hypothetical protein
MLHDLVYCAVIAFRRVVAGYERVDDQRVYGTPLNGVNKPVNYGSANLRTVKGEVDSSILSGSTRRTVKINSLVVTSARSPFVRGRVQRGRRQTKPAPGVARRRDTRGLLLLPNKVLVPADDAAEDNVRLGRTPAAAPA